MDLKNEFEKWLVEIDGKSPNTAKQYKSSINSISHHYSKHTNKMIDLYNINVNNISFIKGLARDYGLGGKFQNFGQNGSAAIGHATIRNAIAAYARFIEYKNSGNYEPSDDEQDLKNVILAQVEELFPDHKIFGNEYQIDKKRTDLLLENTKENSLLIIELKTGIADHSTFAQISNYYGILSKKFPDKNIKCLIIASEIDESLISACSISDKVKIKRYKMRLTLEEVKVNR